MWGAQVPAGNLAPSSRRHRSSLLAQPPDSRCLQTSSWPSYNVHTIWSIVSYQGKTGIILLVSKLLFGSDKTPELLLGCHLICCNHFLILAITREEWPFSPLLTLSGSPPRSPESLPPHLICGGQIWASISDNLWAGMTWGIIRQIHHYSLSLTTPTTRAAFFSPNLSSCCFQMQPASFTWIKYIFVFERTKIKLKSSLREQELKHHKKCFNFGSDISNPAPCDPNHNL